jgi:creatinine amidohydrolase
VITLGDATWPEVEVLGSQGARLLLVVPLGSCEQHGPHLPFDVDTSVVRAVASGLAEADGVVIGPALEYGASGEHEGFAGTVSIGSEALVVVLLELSRSATRWASRVLFVTGHGGNAGALVAATALLRQESRDVAWWPCSVAGGDAHAGRTETSLCLALQPSRVRADRAAAGRREPVGGLMPHLRSDGVAAVSPNGLLGDPAGASADEGQALLAELSGRLCRAVDGWHVLADGRLAGTGAP